MFSFHKPKIYRSNLGCCICKAKSSSSRFTDSNKYENEFERCFRIQEKRSGEICNACVLLVKRWKKLSAESRLTKHWHHVVDARAGPGTKLTGNRRLTGANHSTTDSKNHQRLSNNNNNNKPDVLPLSQVANNQSTSNSLGQQNSSSTSAKVRGVSLAKARAIDTNVSTFTFGEPYHRRSYMSVEHQSYSATSSSSICKPQSALNSSAFESVIKRFRQRQQQEQLDSQRRQQSRQQRQKRRQYTTTNSSRVDNERQTKDQPSSDDHQTTSSVSTKRVKRSSECSISSDVSSLLDGTIWRKEKVCCGYIFRGLFNEVAVLPKLLKPCSCRAAQEDQPSSSPEAATVGDLANDTKQADNDQDLLREESPPPRANKSGSISSCDSNTSGTGSMEPSMEEIQALKRLASATSGLQRQQVAAKRPRSMPTVARQNNKPTTRGRRAAAAAAAVVAEARGQDSSSSSSSSGGKISSPTGSSSSLMLIAGEEELDDDEEEEEEDDIEDEEDEDEMDEEDEEEEEEEEELALDEEDCESGNDVSSNVDSLADLEPSKKSSTIAMGW